MGPGEGRFATLGTRVEVALAAPNSKSMKIHKFDRKSLNLFLSYKCIRLKETFKIIAKKQQIFLPSIFCITFKILPYGLYCIILKV